MSIVDERIFKLALNRRKFFVYVLNASIKLDRAVQKQTNKPHTNTRTRGINTFKANALW